MKSSLKVALIASLLAAAGVTYAMGPMGGQCDMGAGMQGQSGMHHGRMDPDKMQARMDQRLAALKAQLKLTAAQEAAWTSYTTALKPPPSMMAKRPDPAELAKLSTPERIDKMKTLRAQHMSDMSATMDKQGEATKAFYAVLTPEQQKVFDASAVQGPGFGHGRQQGPSGSQGQMPPKS